MKKIVGFLLLLSLIISSCEKDDFCTQNPITNKSLILRFYDNTNRESLKSAENIDVWSQEKDSIFIGITTDSLIIPLNANTNQTIYSIRKNNIVEQITINYTTDFEHVSRSCGFKTIFNDLSISISNDWISDFTLLETTLENQDAAHVQIFH